MIEVMVTKLFLVAIIFIPKDYELLRLLCIFLRQSFVPNETIRGRINYIV